MNRPSRSPVPEVVLIAASLGGVEDLSTVLSGLPRDFRLPIVIAQHRTTPLQGVLPVILGPHCALRVKLAGNGEVVEGGTVYLAPPERHMTIAADRSVRLMQDRRIRQSPVNLLLESASEALDGRVIAVVLTGHDDVGEGVQTVKLWGGTVIAQDRASSAAFGMPGSAIATGSVDQALPVSKIALKLVRLASGSAAAAAVLAA